MGDQSIQRRLAAVLAADVVGYTRLMEEESQGTVAEKLVTSLITSSDNHLLNRRQTRLNGLEMRFQNFDKLYTDGKPRSG